MPPRESRDLPGPKPRQDKERQNEEAVIADADKNDGRDRDAVHGTGESIDLEGGEDLK
jgi:hypothetical protein